MSCEPGHDLRMLVGAVIVRDQMQVEMLGRLAVDLLEKAQPLHVRVAYLRARNKLAGERDQRGKQRDGAMARVIVRHSTRPIGCERQSKLRALQRLTLALLVTAQHESIGRRSETK